MTVPFVLLLLAATAPAQPHVVTVEGKPETPPGNTGAVAPAQTPAGESTTTAPDKVPDESATNGPENVVSGQLTPLKSPENTGPADAVSTLPAGALPGSAVPVGAGLPGDIVPDDTSEVPRWGWLNNPLGSTGKLPKGKKQSAHRFLPLPSLRSQPGVGLMLGASVNYAYRPKDDEPNRIYFFLEARVSLKKVHNYGFFVRLRNMLGRQEIFEMGPTAILDPVLPYYGVANHANLRGQDLTDRYYQVNIQTFGGAINFQHPLWRYDAKDGRPAGVLRSYTGLSYHADHIRPYADSKFAQERAYEEGWTRRGVVRVGLVWDRRDNEAYPRRGALHDVTVDGAGKWTGSSQGWGRISATFRHYWTLGTPSLVLAHRVTFDSLWGDAPFVPLGDFGGLVPVDAIGGMIAGRGWMRRRFVGNNKAYASVELRFDPIEFKIKSKVVGIGMKGYVDMGMVSQTISGLPNHLLVSGGPGVLLIWDRFAVIRLEGGFSRETKGFYLMTEHAF